MPIFGSPGGDDDGDGSGTPKFPRSAIVIGLSVLVGLLIIVGGVIFFPGINKGVPTPTASSGCNQLGCPYPAVCDKTSGVCTINQAQGPSAVVPPPPGAGQIVNNPNPGSLLPPACSPPAPSVSNINSFCANPTAGLGGATWDQNPPDGDPSVAKDAAFINNFSGYPDCNWNQSRTVCSGPQDTKLSYELCTSCGASDSVLDQIDATFGPNVCSKGYVKESNGACLPTNNPYLTSCFSGPGIPASNCPPHAPNQPNYGYYCPSGSHYDNTLQNCADDATNQLASPCPPSYPHFLPDYHLCLAKAYPIVYNCQTFTIPLGVCTTPIKKKNCTTDSNGNTTCH
jgi:hypothetical protein